MAEVIPDSALDDRLGFVGTAGSGKTYNAGSRVERLLDRKARVIIPDPLGVWWGLRLLADGKTPSPFDVVIFGGPHGDLPLNEHAGALIGETVAGSRESAIIDLSEIGTKAAERRFMLAFLTALYRRASGEPVHLIFDEADMWAPQQVRDKQGGEAPRLLGMMETVVRRGRVKGFIPWLISQRPAVLNKDVLSQVDGLVAFKLTSSQDRDALGDWVQGQADKQQWKDIWSSLATMERGQGVVWLPARGILKTARFPEKKTFDSSRTPKRGERLVSAPLKPLDVEGLRTRLASIEAEVVANDPRRLKVEITSLKRELAAAGKQAGIDPKAIEEAERRGRDQGWNEGREIGVREGSAAAMARVREAIEGLGGVVTLPPMERPQRPAPAAPDRQAMPASPRPKANGSAMEQSDRRLGAERRPLAVLASVYPAGMTEAQWAVRAGLKRTGGTWSAYVSRLRSAGRIERDGALYRATEDGLNDLGEAVDPMPAPGPELVEFWASRITGAGKLLRYVAAQYPGWITRDDLADALGITASGGTFSAYLSRLRSPGLIEEDGAARLRASPALMEGA